MERPKKSRTDNYKEADSETREERFIRLAEKRVPRAIQAISSIGKLSNTYAYEFTDADVEKILRALNLAVREVEDKFKRVSSRDQVKFRLK